MKYLNHGWILILASLILSGCQPDAPATSSKVTIQIPTKEEFIKANKVSALAAIDYNLLCFAVNVRGGSIPLVQNRCDVAKGIIEGSVKPGGYLTMDVPFAYKITFEVLGLLRERTSDPCPKVTEKGWSFPINRIYSIGETPDVRIEKAETTVVIGVTMPEIDQNIAKQFNFPNECLMATVDRTYGRFPTAAGVQAGTMFRAYSRATYKEETKSLQGTTFKIEQWKTGVGP